MHRYYQGIDAILAQIGLISSSIPNRLEAFYRIIPHSDRIDTIEKNVEASDAHPIWNFGCKDWVERG